MELTAADRISQILATDEAPCYRLEGGTLHHKPPDIGSTENVDLEKFKLLLATLSLALLPVSYFHLTHQLLHSDFSGTITISLH